MKIMPSDPAANAGLRGFSMVEVLVAVLVLAIGLLGLASLEVTGIHNNGSAFQRAKATLLAVDIAERMSANSAGVVAGSYNNPTSTQVSACLTTTGCTTAQMATNDAYEWTTALSQQLPNGTGTVCVDSTPNDGTSTAAPACDNAGTVFAIKVWWDDARATGGKESFVSSYQP